MRTVRPSIPRFFLVLDATILVVTVALVAFVAGVFNNLHGMLPEQIRLRGYQPLMATEIYSTERHPDGSESHTLLARVYKENREYLPLREIPLSLIHATIAVEDRRFHRHRGISPRDIMRAAWVDITGRGVFQGASTLTQQLVRNVWLSHERTWSRKLKEILLAIEMERIFSKDEILEMYLNEVYYGRGAYGVKIASQVFFQKHPKDLTLAECALLAGLPQRPLSHDPFSHEDSARRRRAEVLEAMVREEHITRDQAAEARQLALVPDDAGRLPAGVDISRAPHFSHLVVRMLTEWYGVDVVYGGGLRVYTSLDMRLQEAAQKHLEQGVQNLRRRGSIKGGLVGQGALACVDVHDGRVLAMVGGVGPFEKVQFNRAHPGPTVYGRQPGSSFKPYVWAAALESGFGPNSVFSANPLSIRTGPGRVWSPRNYTPRQSGNYTLRNALAQSVNLVSVRLVRTLGVERVRTYTSRILDVPKDRLAPFISLSLGVSNISPLEQASGYVVFASGGYRYDRAFILGVEDYWGRTIYRYNPRPQRVLRPESSISMISMLRSVVESGTGTRARMAGYTCAGKTGTTQDGRDAWWVGFTPDLSAAVWVGNDDYSPMRGSSGGGFCAPIWRQFMQDAMKTLNYNGKFPEGAGVVPTRASEPEEEKEEEQKPQTVTICADTGNLATPYCPRTREKTLPAGQSAPRTCTAHRAPGGVPPEGEEVAPEPAESPARPSTGSATVSVNICTESGKPAGPHCPNSEERSFPAGQAPGGTCAVHKGPDPD